MWHVTGVDRYVLNDTEFQECGPQTMRAGGGEINTWAPEGGGTIYPAGSNLSYAGRGTK